MLERVENARLNGKNILLGMLILIVGFILRQMEIPFSFLCMPIAGALSLAIQFGQADLKYFVKPMKKGSWKYVLLFFLLMIVLSAVLGVLNMVLSGVDLMDLNSIQNAAAGVQDRAAADVSSPDLWKRLWFLATAWLSICGEELAMAAIVFPLHHALAKNMSRNKAFFLATLASAVVFAAMHLRVYNWDWVMCLVCLAPTRFPLNYAWKKTDSLRGGFYPHILYDYQGFLGTILNMFR